MLNELLNLYRKCAVVRDDVPSIRNNNNNMVLAVDCARADHKCVDICFPPVESQSIPIFSRYLHAQAATGQLGLIVPLPVPFFNFPLPPVFLASSRVRLIHWVRPTFRAQVAFLHSANKLRPC